MNLAIIGGGITGLSTALEAVKRGANVSVFERNKIMMGTSRSSTKLLHGGLRYLENLEFGLVRESLIERSWWIDNVPNLAKPIQLYLPIYKDALRSRLKYKLGLLLYDILAGKKNIKNHKWLNKTNFIKNNKLLNSNNLDGGFVFYDGQMDDYNLGLWVANEAKERGVKIREDYEIHSFNNQGKFIYSKKNSTNNYESKIFDYIIVAAGSYTEELLVKSNFVSEYKINHVRGSHIIINRHLDKGYFLEYPKEKRIFFVLPYKNQTMIGTTEEKQDLNDNVQCSHEEISYLINGYNYYFKNKITKKDVINVFSGLRPLIHSGKNNSNSSREYAIQKNKKIISIYGGKWTTSRSLARKICDKINLIKK